jgi:hypothetical protein
MSLFVIPAKAGIQETSRKIFGKPVYFQSAYNITIRNGTVIFYKTFTNLASNSVYNIKGKRCNYGIKAVHIGS